MDRGPAPRRIQAFLPWAALAAVSVFAVAQLKQRRAAEARCAALLQVAAASPGQATTAVDPADSWIAEVQAATKPEAVAAIKLRAAKATPRDVEALAAAVEDAPARKPLFARFAGSLPDSPETTALLVTLLDVPLTDDPAERVAALGAARLMRSDVLAPTFRDARAGVVRELLPHAAARAQPWGEADLAAFAVALEGRLASQDPESAETAARVAGVLRVPGLAGGLASLLASSHPRVRAAAAYALSRVPDRATVRVQVQAAMKSLRDDPDAAVRTAGDMLASAMAGP